MSPKQIWEYWKSLRINDQVLIRALAHRYQMNLVETLELIASLEARELHRVAEKALVLPDV
jgi:hypothetical protein